MAERAARTYSRSVGRFHFGLAGFWVLLGLVDTAVGDRLFAVFCFVFALGSGLNGANELWWRGTNRWFRPAAMVVLAAITVLAVVFVARFVGDLRAQV